MKMALFDEINVFFAQGRFFPATNRGGSAKSCGGNAKGLSYEISKILKLLLANLPAGRQESSFAQKTLVSIGFFLWYRKVYRCLLTTENRRKLFLKAILLLAILLTGFITANAQEEYVQAPAAIQISSTASEGKLSIPEIIGICRKNNIKIVMLADRDFMRWEYGLWPLERIIKKTEESNSLSTYGISRYFKEIEGLRNKNRDLVIIPGVESAPFYYWQGNPFGRDFKIIDWHKHILVFGLEKVSDYNKLPSVSNELALMRTYSYKDIFLFWPLLIFILGVLCLHKRQFDYQDARGRQLGRYSKKWAISGACLMFIAVIFLLNNFPFRSFKYDQYHGQQGVMPYQDLINYANQKGGLAFWAHPEAENIQKIGRVGIETREHTADLLKSFDYTGFAVFYEGYKKIGLPGGLWDELLKQYCRGQRNSPVWAIGGLSFDQTGDLDKSLKDLRTVLLMPELSKDAALTALKLGKMYVLRGSNSSQFVLDSFNATDNGNGPEKVMGETLCAPQQSAAIHIKGHFLNGQSKPCKIKLIKNGNIVDVFEINTPFNFSYIDKDIYRNGKSYYRIEAVSDGLQLITNPIFMSVD